MKRIFLFILILCFAVKVFPQKNINFGVFGGTSYYMGDINPNRHFYKPGLSFGLLYRINFNKHYALRANGYYANLSGDDVDFPSLYHPGTRHIHPANFNTKLIDFAMQFEFNFFPYVPNEKKWDYTTYVAGGIGYSVILSSAGTSTTPAIPHLTFPFGIGVKINLTKRISAGIEWSFRKAFNDRVDGVTNDIHKQSYIHNNDWYSFAGIFITYKFFNFAADCPVYD